ncbi:MAG: benzoate-CoA ligase family protein [Alphaproteobacteria bacterium]
MPENRAPGGRSAHVDTFAAEHLPPKADWPPMNYDTLPELKAYPDRMNCAVELLDKQCARFGERPVMRSPTMSLTYNQLNEAANRIAHVLVDDFGLKPGERVLLRSPNNPMYVACWFAVMKAGGIVCATMPLLRNREIAFIADSARVRLALCDERLADELKTAMSSTKTVEHAVHFDGLGGGQGELEKMAAGKPATFEACDTAADDVCLIAFTSGTTGQPKGAMHFHRDILAMCDCFSTYVLKPGPDDIFAGSPPIAFTFGLGALVAFPMHCGASTFLVEAFTPDSLLATMNEQQVTVLFTAPTMFRALTPLTKATPVPSLAKCVSAGETLPKATWEGWHEATGIKIIDGIGSTEMLHIFIACEGDEIKPGATGKPIPGYEATILDDDGNEVPAGTIGRLAVRGPTGCRYLSNPERQAAYVAHGWNLTGDAYLKDEDGYYHFQARTDDMIIASGYNIAGPEVEAVLMEHPAVAECAVVGAPDPERGTVVKAFVVAREPDKAGPDLVKALQDHVKATIAPYKYPRAVEFLDALPKTQTGKIQRFALREDR